MSFLYVIIQYLILNNRTPAPHPDILYRDRTLPHPRQKCVISYILFIYRRERLVNDIREETITVLKQTFSTNNSVSQLQLV